MKRKLLLLLLIAALLLPCVACTGGTTPADTDGATNLPVTGAVGTPTDPSDGTEADTPPAETEAETEAPEPIMGARMDLVAHTLSGADGKVTLSFSAEAPEEEITADVTLILFTGEQSLDQQTLTGVSGTRTVELTCPADALAGELSLYAVATAAGSTELLDEMVLELKGGLPRLTPDGVRCVVAAMTDEEKAHLVTGVQNPVKPGASGGTFAIDRLGIPSITVNDGPAGVRYGTAVWYPSVHNLTASWDPALIASVGQSIGEDSLALGIDIVLGPGMNIQKNVLCGRNFEYCSEDPILTALMSAAYVSGMQSSGAGACI